MAARTLFRYQRPSKSQLREWLAGYLFASPFIIGFLVFTAFPMLYSIWLAFQRWDLLSPPKYIGLQNIIKMFQDPVANLSLYNSFYYTIFAVPIQLVISFFLALASANPCSCATCTGRFLPADHRPLVASAVVWQRVFSQTTAS